MIEYSTIAINKISADIIRTSRYITVARSKYMRICMGYDTETTRIKKHSYVYHFAVSMGSHVFGFRRWEHFLSFIDHINAEMHKRFRRSEKPPILLIWVANLSFEFQFLKDRKKWDVFATDSRQPLTAAYQYVQLREALRISGGNLAYLAKTYCKTRKMIGDLDYTKIRNSKTPLTEKELGYIENDVVILSEFADYIFKMCIGWGCMPYTSTGILRAECRAEIKNDSGYKKYIKDNYFTPKEYKVYMHYLFRGGYTHANRAYINQILEDVESYDKKSSYPSKMLQAYFPIGKFKTVPRYKRSLLDEYCCILDVKFYNLKNRTTHSIESSHKIIESIYPKYDNGRLMSAKMAHVLLTELDFKIYEKYYKWDRIVVLNCKIAMRGECPEFIRRLVLKYFVLKEQATGLDRVVAKTRVNVFYGLSVTRLHFLEWIYSGDWIQREAQKKDGSPKEWEDFIKSEFMLPTVGIWITSHARYDLLSLIYDMWQFVVYADTDSIYLVKGYDKSKIEAKNAELRALNLSGDQSNFTELGCYEYEGRYKRFKTLGAKKYIKEYYRSDVQPRTTYKIIDRKKAARQVIHRSYYCSLHLCTQTIAGLGKYALQEYCNKTGEDLFDIFKPDMLLVDTYTQKLISHYEDSPHSDIVDGELMQELSSISLIPSDFKMNVDENLLYLAAITKIDRSDIPYGDRLEKNKNTLQKVENK